MTFHLSRLYYIFECVSFTYIKYIFTAISQYFWHVMFYTYLNVLNNIRMLNWRQILLLHYRAIKSIVDRRCDCSTHCLWESGFALCVINCSVYSSVWNHDCFIMFQCKFFTHFSSSNILTEYGFCTDMMFPSYRHGLSLWLAVIYFLVSVALSLPSD